MLLLAGVDLAPLVEITAVVVVQGNLHQAQQQSIHLLFILLQLAQAVAARLAVQIAQLLDQVLQQ
jgi:hypothetical protein